MNTVFSNAANITLDELNNRCEGTLNTSLGIIYTEIGPDFVKATMPVNANTIQPMGMLNGGASMALIETLGSMAANLVIDRETTVAFGQSIQGSHIRPAFIGETVIGIAKPVHLGLKTQIWDVEILNQKNKLVCKGSITMAVVAKPDVSK